MKRGIEYRSEENPRLATIYGIPTDIHMHPRIFDPRFPDLPEIPNGKAGVDLYTETALRNGFLRGLFMPNETVRIYNPDMPDQTEIYRYPITTADRLLAALSISERQSRIISGLIVGADQDAIGLGQAEKKPKFTTKEIRRFFSNRLVTEYAAALKLYGGETTGGYNIPLETIQPIAKVWDRYNHGKPLYLHLEDEAVGQVLEDWPDGIPVHIAHVSSRQELEPIIIAKNEGKDVTCEVTPHHLFLSAQTRRALGAYGCMKPTLKKKSDVNFLWRNLEYIDIFASDCAPHRLIDKIGIDHKGLANPAFGVTNHEVFLPLFFQAIEEGRLTEGQLFDRIVTNPAARFNLPEQDAIVQVSLQSVDAEAAALEVPYGYSPFPNSPETPPLLGRIKNIAGPTGRLLVRNSRLTQDSLPKPQNLIRF